MNARIKQVISRIEASLKEVLRQWFEVQYHSMVWDLSDEPIEHEDWD
jgi:hypothetical protein